LPGQSVCVFATDDGVLRGTDLAALGAPSGFLQTITTDRSADTTIGLRFTQYDFFVQDNWKLHPNFTINAGPAMNSTRPNGREPAH